MSRRRYKTFLLPPLPSACSFSAAGLERAGPRRNRSPCRTILRRPAPYRRCGDGKRLFFDYSCYACHGYNGETGARAFVGNWGHLATEQEFITFLRGRANVAPEPKSTGMPNFAEKHYVR